jgi:hypothetical protein
MDRMAHSSTRAAMIYIHGSDARQHEIVDTLSQLVRQELVTIVAGRPARHCLLGLADSLRAAGVPALPVEGKGLVARC